jgi:large subunit ribosomal protein L16
MGKGKGSVAYWAAKIKSGTVLFEMCGVDDLKSIPALKTGGAKLPIKTIIFS